MALNGLMAKEVKEVCVTENLHALVIHFLLHVCILHVLCHAFYIFHIHIMFAALNHVCTHVDFCSLCCYCQLSLVYSCLSCLLVYCIYVHLKWQPYTVNEE